MDMFQYYISSNTMLPYVISPSGDMVTFSGYSNASDPAHQNLSVMRYAEPPFSSTTYSAYFTGAADNPQLLQEPDGSHQ